MKDVGPATRWLKFLFEDEDIWFFLELDDEGWPLRQVELEGPERTPITASSLAEMPDARTSGPEAVREYESRYGGLGDQPLSEWPPEFPHELLTSYEFEAAWTEARRLIESR